MLSRFQWAFSIDVNLCAGLCSLGIPGMKRSVHLSVLPCEEELSSDMMYIWSSMFSQRYKDQYRLFFRLKIEDFNNRTVFCPEICGLFQNDPMFVGRCQDWIWPIVACGVNDFDVTKLIDSITSWQNLLANCFRAPLNASVKCVMNYRIVREKPARQFRTLRKELNGARTF